MFRQKILIEELSSEELDAPMGDWVDVRDAAAVHLAAMENEAAGGERFLASAGPWSIQEIRECPL